MISRYEQMFGAGGRAKPWGENSPHLSVGAFSDLALLDFSDEDWREENLIAVTLGVVVPQSLCVSAEPEFGEGE